MEILKYILDNILKKITKCFLILSIVALSVSMLSCSSAVSFNTLRSNEIKLDESAKIYFKEGDIIYFVNLDTSRISFHCTDDSLVKNKEPKNINLSYYTMEVKDTTIKNNIFNSLEQKIIDLSPSLKQFIVNDYNEFANDISTDVAMSKYKKHLVLKQIEWKGISDSFRYEVFYTPHDSVRLEISVPKNINEFCNAIKSDYPDAGYIMVNSRVYLTNNIFKGEVVEESVNYLTGFTFPGYTCDDAYSFAPLLVIDVKNAKLISIDSRVRNPVKWKDLIRRNHHLEDDANFYKFYF